MEIAQRGLGGVIILDLDGRLIFGDGEQPFREKVDELMEQGHNQILINLDKVTYLDSAGVGALIWKYITLVRRGGVLKLLNLKSRAHTVLSVTRLLSVLESFDDELDAVVSFSKPSAPPGSRSSV